MKRPKQKTAESNWLFIMMQNRKKTDFFKKIERLGEKTKYFFSVRSIVSIIRRPSRDEIVKELAALPQKTIENLTPEEALKSYSQLLRRFKRQIEQPATKPEQVELMSVCSALLLVFAQSENKHWQTSYENAVKLEKKSRNAFKKNKSIWVVNDILRLRRRLLYTQLKLVELSFSQGIKKDLADNIKHAISSGLLIKNEWARLIDIALTKSISKDDLLALAVVYYNHCGRVDGKVSEQLEQFLKDELSGKPGDSYNITNKKERILRRLQLAAPWLDWPVLFLARNEIDNNKLSTADEKLSILHTVLKNESIRAEVSLLLGQLKYINENYELADQYFGEALEGGADDSSIHEFIGITKAHSGELETALKHIEQALSLSSDDYYLLTQKANILLSLNQFEEAKKLYKEIIKNHKKNIDALYGLGKIIEAEGKLELAQKIFQSVIKKSPDHIEAKCSIASILIRRHEYEEGEKILEGIIEQNPYHLPSLIELGISRVREGILSKEQLKVNDGIDLLKRCDTEKTKDQRVLYWLGRALAYLARYEECLSYWMILQKEMRDSNESTFNLDISTIRLKLSLEMIKNREFDQAANILKDLVDFNIPIGNVQDILCEVQMQMAFQAMEENDFDGVLNLVDQVLLIQPQKGQAHLIKIIVLFYQGKLKDDTFKQSLNNIESGDEKEVIIFFRDLVGKKIPLEDNSALTEVSSILSGESLPNMIRSSKTFLLIVSIIDAVTGSDEIQNDYKLKIKNILDQLFDNNGTHGIDQVQLSWWMAWHLSNNKMHKIFEQKLKEIASLDIEAQDKDLIRMTECLLNVCSKSTIQKGLMHMESLHSKLCDELKDYMGKAYCYNGYQAILSIKKDPTQIKQAKNSFLRAIKL